MGYEMRMSKRTYFVIVQFWAHMENSQRKSKPKYALKYELSNPWDITWPIIGRQFDKKKKLTCAEAGSFD